MNKEELKLENIITYDGVIATVKCLHYKYLTVAFNVGGEEVLSDVRYDKCAGLPLSPALLEKCGFVDDGNKKQSVWVYRDKNLSFSIAESQLEDNEMYISCDNAFSGINTVTGVKYLHQIQNIVSALTGQELQIIL